MSENVTSLFPKKTNFARLEMYALSNLSEVVNLRRQQGEHIDYETLLRCFNEKERDLIARELLSIDGGPA